MHGQITIYVTLIIIKSLCSKCLIFKSSSGKYFAVKNIKLPSKCWNGKIFKSSDSQILYCLESQSAKHDSFICVLDDSLIINSRDENQMDYKIPEVPEVSHTPDDLNCYTDENGDYVCDKEPSTSPSPLPCECGTANPTKINQNRIMYATGIEADILEIFKKK